MGYGLDIGIKQDSHAPAAKESRNFIGEQRVEVIGNPDFPLQIPPLHDAKLRVSGRTLINPLPLEI